MPTSATSAITEDARRCHALTQNLGEQSSIFRRLFLTRGLRRHSVQAKGDKQFGGGDVPARAKKRLVDGPEEFRYLLGGKEVEGTAALEASVLAVGLEQGVVQGFHEWDQFDEWAAGTEVAHEIQVTRKRLAAVQEREDSDTSWAERTSVRRVERVIENCEAFAREIGVEVGSPEFFNQAIVDPDPLLGPIEGDLLDPYMILWDNPCGGPSCYGSGKWGANFRWDSCARSPVVRIQRPGQPCRLCRDRRADRAHVVSGSLRMDRRSAMDPLRLEDDRVRQPRLGWLGLLTAVVQLLAGEGMNGGLSFGWLVAAARPKRAGQEPVNSGALQVKRSWLERVVRAARGPVRGDVVQVLLHRPVL